MFIPEVGVIVPACNVQRCIKGTLLSLESQTFKDFEALVIDGGSTDRTSEIVKSFYARDSRFKLLQKSNGGVSSARNYGIRHARGEYIALLNGGDLYSPEKLASHYAWMESSPQIGVVYSASQAIHDDGTLTFMRLSGKPIKREPLVALLCKNFIGHGSNAVFRRCIFDEVGEFDETLNSCQDVDYWLRIAATKKWRFHRESRVQCFYRVPPSKFLFDIGEIKSNQLQVIIAACKRNPELIDHLLPTAYAYMNWYLSRLCLNAGDTDLAKRYIDSVWYSDRSIFFKDPSSLLTLIRVHLASLSQLL